MFNRRNEPLFRFYLFTRVRKNINLHKNPQSNDEFSKPFNWKWWKHHILLEGILQSWHDGVSGSIFLTVLRMQDYRPRETVPLTEWRTFQVVGGYSQGL